MTYFSKHALLAGASAVVMALGATAASAAHISYNGSLAGAQDGDPVNNLLDGPFEPVAEVGGEGGGGHACVVVSGRGGRALLGGCVGASG